MSFINEVLMARKGLNSPVMSCFIGLKAQINSKNVNKVQHGKGVLRKVSQLVLQVRELSIRVYPEVSGAAVHNG